MRFSATRKFWVVSDPGSDSEMADCLYQASMEDLYLQIKGGMTLDRNPTLFTDKAEAELEAYGRLTALRAAQTIRTAIAEGRERPGPWRVEIVDERTGKTIFKREI